ncbi:SIS domain-containing protein [Candidatus Woesearchaeota archaeon]|nr:SIS domain-containing protein [Candidatus Woesearchaeota archaeon]
MVNIYENSTADFTWKYYTPRLLKGILALEPAALIQIACTIAEAIKQGQRVFAFGNGGSAALAEQFIDSLIFSIPQEFPFDSYANVPYHRAIKWPNEIVFNQEVIRKGRKGDVAVLISASGNSLNILNVSKLCKKKEIVPISISQNGKICNDYEAKPLLQVIIAEPDQQIAEDITHAALQITCQLASIACSTTLDEQNVLEQIKHYAQMLDKELQLIDPNQIVEASASIAKAFTDGQKVFIEAPCMGNVAIQAHHGMHNLKWDGLSHIQKRPSNMVISGFDFIHLSGVGNDGGDGFNHAIEIADNSSEGDIALFFSTEQDKEIERRISLAAQKKEVRFFSLRIPEHPALSAQIAQTIIHLLGRTLNAYLHVQEGNIGKEEFASKLGNDLANLRYKEPIRKKLIEEYGEIQNG